MKVLKTMLKDIDKSARSTDDESILTSLQKEKASIEESIKILERDSLLKRCEDLKSKRVIGRFNSYFLIF